MVKRKVDCDRCRVPGHCCRRLELSNGGTKKITYKVGIKISSIERSLRKLGLPFKPIFRSRFDEKTGREIWTYNCPKLLPNGRCGDYENRPKLCREYEPGRDHLCYHVCKEGTTEPIVPLLKKGEKP